MSIATTYAAIHHPEAVDTYKQFNITALAPFDAMKVCLEQALYYTYLKATCSTTTTLDTYKLHIGSLVGNLRWKGEHDTKEALFEKGVAYTRYLLSDPNTYSNVDTYPQDLFAIFDEPNQQNYVNKEYTATITNTFLTEWVSLFLGWYDEVKYQDGTLYESALFVPSPKPMLEYNPYVPSTRNQDYTVVLFLEQKPLQAFDMTAARLDPSKATLANVLHRCSFDCNVDAILGLIASFALDHDQYVMTDNNRCPTFRMSDICYKLVNGSLSDTCISAGELQVTDRGEMFETLRTLVDSGRLERLQEYTLFGQLLAMLGEDRKIVDYFTKPVETVSASEALTYRKSDYIGWIPDKLIAGMEAADDDPDDEDDDKDKDKDEDTPSEDTGEGGMFGADPDDTTDEGGTTTVEEDSTTDSTDAIDDTLDKEPMEDPASNDEDKKREIDPDKLLLQLANPNESMSDYIYREMVGRRITNILKNPPANALPNDLLMLKRWKSRWLYLTSIACLRDFLTRVSLRLSDVK